ncbi:hypothetical protein D3C72_1547150 [compost metagenome]
MHGHVGAGGHGDTHIGRGQRRRIVDAVAHHRHHRAALSQFLHARGLVLGQYLGLHLVQAQRLRHACRGARVVAGQHHGAHARCAQPCDRRRCTRLDGIAECAQTCHARRRGFDQPRHGAALVAQPLRHRRQRTRFSTQRCAQALAAKLQRLAVHHAGNASSRQCSDFGGLRHGDAARLRRRQHRARQRMLATGLQRGQPRKQAGAFGIG